MLQGKDNISDLALQFLGGVLAKAPSFCAVTNPTVNSYKRPRGFNPKKKHKKPCFFLDFAPKCCETRLNGASTASGSTWSPNRNLSVVTK